MNMNIQYRKEGDYHKSQKNQSLERISWLCEMFSVNTGLLR